MEPKNRQPRRGDPSDCESARFWGEPAEDRRLEFDEK
jgi:hypothetical protein